MIRRFGRFRLDGRGRELRVKGRVRHTEPLVFGFLWLLADAGGDVVSRAECERVLWQGVHVTRASLRQVVMQARRAVGDDGRRQRVIRTVRAQGYRLVLPVRSE